MLYGHCSGMIGEKKCSHVLILIYLVDFFLFKKYLLLLSAMSVHPSVRLSARPAVPRNMSGMRLQENYWLIDLKFALNIGNGRMHV